MTEPIIGAFIFWRVLTGWSMDEAARRLAALRAFGVNTLFTEAEAYRDDLIALAHRLDLRFVGGLACFLDLSGDARILERRPELWPVLETGERRPKMAWYTGLTPTFEDYQQQRLTLMAQALDRHDLDGYLLDFVRWPLHWEAETRPGAPRPPDSSFDPHTVRRFLAESGLAMPAGLQAAAAQARWILDEHRAAWIDFKCQVIADFVAQAAALTAHHRAWLGAYLVPVDEDRRAALVGQRARDLAPLVDLLLPMTYHSIVHQPPEWVTAVAADVAAHAPGRVLPVVQVAVEPDPDTDDYAPPRPLPVEEWAQVAAAAYRLPGGRGLVAFTGMDLFDEGRGQALRRAVT